jgi:two-component system sensor histidine kinase DegS
MSEDSDVQTRITIKGTRRKLLPEAEVTIFRVVQEALSNIKRHSKATKAVVTVEFGKEDLKITIEDNGQGFRQPQKPSRLAARGQLGLIGMRQRVDLLGGTLKIRSKIGGGTSLLIEAKC